MAKDPAVLFYTSDFLVGTATMTDAQVGKYIRLLCLQHQKGRLTKKDMMHICKTYDKIVFKKFQKDSQGNYYNIKMENEMTRRKKYSESRRENRLASSSYVKHMETATVTETKSYLCDNKNCNNQATKTLGLYRVCSHKCYQTILEEKGVGDNND